MPYKSVLEVIGHTPLVKLNHMVTNPLATVLVKLEYLNPSSSIKDRIIVHIIDDAEKQGLLVPGATIIESTSGNTGAALAMLGAVRGYRIILTMPDKVSEEKKNTLKAFGAEIIVAPTTASSSSPEHYSNVAKALEKSIPGSFRINQYDNIKNPEAHYLTTAPEIWQQTDGQIDYFVASASTGGTISGVGRYLKEKNPRIVTVMPDPIGSVYYTYFKTRAVPKEAACTYHLEGIGEDHVTHAIDFTFIDRVVEVSDREAFDVCRQLARQEGILAGGSTGANVWGALQIAKEVQKPTTIVTIAPDGGVKYLSKIYNDEWMKAHNLL